MMATRMLLLLILTVLGFIGTASSQDCSNCKLIPKVTQFDFDVQVPVPNAGDNTQNLWPEWKKLFLMAGFVESGLMQQNTGCIIFTMPPSVDTGGLQEVTLGGESFTNLPSNPNISQDLSAYGDYLITGRITRQGSSCHLHVELLTACSRKSVTTADVDFQLADFMQNAMSVSAQAVSQMSPLAEKIKTFELEERQKNKSLSLVQLGENPILIKVDKKTLKAGESTSFTIELKDCDGTPLAGREIIFSETAFEGLRLYKTKGGVVSPAKVMTDANGKATASFTLNSGAREAVIQAHSLGKNVRGCASAFTGSAYINIKIAYSGFLRCQYTNTSNCSEQNSTDCLQSSSSRKFNMNVEYTSVFYQEGEKSNAFFISYDGHQPGSDAEKIPRTIESGSYILNDLQVTKGVITCASAIKNKTTIQRIKSGISGEIKESRMSFEFGEGNTGSVGLHLVFKTKSHATFEQTNLPTQNQSEEAEANVDVEFDSLVDKDFKIKKVSSGGKTKYFIEGVRRINTGCAMNATMIIKMEVWEE